MRKLSLILLAVVCLSMTGCVNMWIARHLAESAESLTFYAVTPEALPVESTASFSIGTVSDSSGFEFKDSFDPKEALRAPLQSKLEKDNPTGKDSPQYVVNVDIEKYVVSTDPVSFTFNRASVWVTATIVDQEGNHRATIASNSMGSPFNNIPTWIVEVIRNPEKRISREEYARKMHEAAQENFK